ncbi:hypothetical protein [Actinomadura rugatobispora]|uniref:Uncharacterized protein n=1 Tax=Actinomadura rugatobispora TaxID=1994 RepID=A0ABW0ZWN5_9ACTN|nr:hypothetical protein GCM10010200_017100 [Actinomadura rugatobispora]
MTASPELAPATEIRAYLIDEMNLALRRPGMYGGEVALELLLGHLLFVERDRDDLTECHRAWEKRGIWTSTGVTGAFWWLLPKPHDHDMASVYAEYARARGWLKPDRVLSAQEYAALRAAARPWAERDRVWTDVTAEFGPPSVRLGGGNPRYGKVLGYLTEDPDAPVVFFHLWNGPEREEEAVLLAVRFGDGPFGETFTFTPEGHRRKPRRQG